MAIILEIGKVFETRGGLIARIYETIIIDCMPMHRGVVEDSDPQNTIWNHDGSHFINSKRDIVKEVTIDNL